jgi:hypothetical protein
MMTGYEYILSLLFSGSIATEESAPAGDRLVLFPARLMYREFLSAVGLNPQPGCRYLPYLAAVGGSIGNRWKTAAWLRNLWQVLDQCRRVELFFLSPRLDWTAAYAATAVVRLKDFSVLDDPAGYRRRLLRSLCLSPGAAGQPLIHPLIAPEPYRQARKPRAVPHVIVVADFENERSGALARRAYELVKQKYPRTQFIMISITDGVRPTEHLKADQPTHRLINGERDWQSVFIDGDSVMLLSPGGINELVSLRARAAGFPIIVNGFGFAGSSSSPSNTIVVPRDSYSALAEAVIRLVDDDGYYRSFASH